MKNFLRDIPAFLALKALMATSAVLEHLPGPVKPPLKRAMSFLSDMCFAAGGELMGLSESMLPTQIPVLESGRLDVLRQRIILATKYPCWNCDGGVVKTDRGDDDTYCPVCLGTDIDFEALVRLRGELL